MALLRLVDQGFSVEGFRFQSFAHEEVEACGCGIPIGR